MTRRFISGMDNLFLISTLRNTDSNWCGIQGWKIVEGIPRQGGLSRTGDDLPFAFNEAKLNMKTKIHQYFLEILKWFFQNKQKPEKKYVVAALHTKYFWKIGFSKRKNAFLETFLHLNRTRRFFTSLTDAIICALSNMNFCTNIWICFWLCYSRYCSLRLSAGLLL